jgi:hypothetical protein
MAVLATKANLVASLNVLVAARQHQRPEHAFTDKEIVDILLAMTENTLITQSGPTIPKFAESDPENLYS